MRKKRTFSIPLCQEFWNQISHNRYTPVVRGVNKGNTNERDFI